MWADSFSTRLHLIPDLLSLPFRSTAGPRRFSNQGQSRLCSPGTPEAVHRVPKRSAARLGPLSFLCTMLQNSEL